MLSSICTCHSDNYNWKLEYLPQVGLIPKNYVQELHEVVDARTPRSREPSQTRQLPPPGPSNSAPHPPATNGGAHNAETHLAQVC